MSIKIALYFTFFQKYLRMSQKSSTFARSNRGSTSLGPPKILIFGESGNKAKIHMSDEVANRIEP